MHYVYILHAPAHDKFYVGQTPDLQTRLLFHNELSEHSYTSKYRPWVLMKSIEVADRSTAVKMERYIKGRKSRDYILKLIHDDQAVELLRKKFEAPLAG